MKNILQERRKDAEMQFIKMCKMSRMAKLNTVDKIKVKLFKIFFDIYDEMENSRHAEYIDKLYFFDNDSLAKLENIANEVFVDISTLRRYRQKYIKAILYIIDPPVGSCLQEIIANILT